MRIALLEDDEFQSRVMQVWLQAVGHDCVIYHQGQDLIAASPDEKFDLFILDWELPDISGLEVLKWLRAHLDWPTPVVFVTRRDAEQDIVLALESGADDFMSKPVKPLEMLARITALGRRVFPQQEVDESLEFSGYRLSSANRSVSWADQEVSLTQKEFDLALFLFRNIGRLLSRSHMLECVWGCTADLNTRTVDTHVSRLRNKLQLNPDNGWRLSAVYQHGYRLERLEQAAEEIAAKS